MLTVAQFWSLVCWTLGTVLLTVGTRAVVLTRVEWGIAAGLVLAGIVVQWFGIWFMIG